MGLIQRASLLLAMGLVLSAAAHAGQLAPPAGAVAPSMKDLSAIEPRLLLRDVPGNASCVHRITAPGQYVATANVIVPAGKHGILLELPPGMSGTVSIDLNGFEIQGQPGSLDGVRKAGAFVACNFNIQNGTIIGMGGDGAHIENTEEANLCISVRQCGGDGMEFMGIPVVSAVAINSKAPPPGAGNIVKGMGGHCVRASGCGQVVIDLTMSDAAQDGLRIENADRCDLSFDIARCAGNGVTITGCPDVQAMAINKPASYWGIGVRHRVAQCGGSGVVITQCDDVQMTGLRVSGSGGGGGGVVGAGRGVAFSGCARVILEDAVVTEGTSHGFDFFDCGGVTLRRCEASDVGGDGLHATASMPAASTKGRWIEIQGWDMHVAGGNGLNIEAMDSVLLDGGVVRACGGDGVYISSSTGASDKFAQVRGFKVERCAGDGMEIECDTLEVAGCETRDNGGSGVYAKDVRKQITINLFTSTNNQGHGLRAPAVLAGVRQQGKSTQVTRSNISNNRMSGVSLEIAGSLTMADVEASGNDMSGCDALLLPVLGGIKEKAKQLRCSFTGNGFGTPEAFPGCVIRGAASVELREVDCSGNAASGLVLADWSHDSRLDFVTCSGNGEYGLRCTTFTGVPSGRFRARDVMCDGNGFDGMLLEATSGGEVADSTFSSNGALGLRVLSFSHIVQRNSFLANTGGPMFALLPGNSVAPIVDEGTIATNCNPSANHVR